MSKRFYFAIEDGCYDPETGETDEAGLCVGFDGPDAPEDVMAFAERNLPCYAGLQASLQGRRYAKRNSRFARKNRR